MKKYDIAVYPDNHEGRPIYRYYKLIYTAALRLKQLVPIGQTLHIFLNGEESNQPKYKNRTTYSGTLTIDGKEHSDIIYVVDTKHQKPELVTFWRKSQPGDAAGAKGGAHPFAEAYLGFLMGKILESQIFTPERVIEELSDIYNSDPHFNVTAWIIKNSHSSHTEPALELDPIETTTQRPLPNAFIPELILKNKWSTDVLRTGIGYTNYEVDACIKGITWGSDDRIECELHWEDGKFIHIRDFGRFDRYADKTSRQRVFNYMKAYANTASRVRIILTVKGNSDQWVLASATMLRRLTIP